MSQFNPQKKSKRKGLGHQRMIQTGRTIELVQRTTGKKYENANELIRAMKRLTRRLSKDV